ncbi:MAG: ATP-grasp domain-containing protein [Patescibacteria group bacterium]
MAQKQNNPVLVVTNPLHYAYYSLSHNLPAIGSFSGLVADSGSELGFAGNIRLYDVPNNVDALIEAHISDDGHNSQYITWKPPIKPHSILGNLAKLAHDLERKSVIRSLLPKELFPPFKIVAPEDLNNLEFEMITQELKAESLVVQIDFSTGGKGTFFVANKSQLDALKLQLKAAQQSIVISKRINGTSRGLQVLAAKEQVSSTAWWHQDLLNIHGVYNHKAQSASRYCGAVLENIPDKYQHKISNLITQVGSKMLEQGYFGVFGIDIVVDEESGQVYLIEVNPRFTAVSHLYASAMRATGYRTDFLTCHVKGLVGTVDPEILELSVMRSLPGSYYYLKIQNTLNQDVKLNPDCRLGIYDEKGTYQKFGFGIDALGSDQQIVVIPEVSHSHVIVPGRRAFSLIGRGNPLTANNQLSDKIVSRINQLQAQFLETIG